MDAIFIEFDSRSDLPDYPGKQFIFLNGSNQSNGKPHGGFTWSRAINKNIVSTTLPVSSYEGGGLAVDIGMSEDAFELNYTTYSYDDYRYLAALVKCNNDLRAGELVFVYGNHTDRFSVAIRNVQFNAPAGKGEMFTIKLSLLVVDPTLSYELNNTVATSVDV